MMAKDRHEQPPFDLAHKVETHGPVECLGITFPNDEARRKHFLDILREKLQDSEFRQIEGFPIGSDEDILALSDPPYYTACPHPFMGDFIAHSYHTKVPYKAIMRYVLHFTEPGDIVPAEPAVRPGARHPGAVRGRGERAGL